MLTAQHPEVTLLRRRTRNVCDGILRVQDLKNLLLYWKSYGIGLWRSLASALAWGARGPEFKSRQPDQIPHTLTDSRPPQGAVWSPSGVQVESRTDSAVSRSPL